jgi:hypothetical protein
MRSISRQLNFTHSTLSHLRRGHELLTFIRATDHSAINRTNNEFQVRFAEVAFRFTNHQALNHPFFDYLKEKSQHGFNSIQWQIYWHNFARRTELTIPSVATSIKNAALEGDMKTLAYSVRNIYDEGGYGDPNKIHSQLLLNSHNQHGSKVFGVNPLCSLRDAKKSPFLVTEVEEYRKAKFAAFKKSAAAFAGNSWAHELAADRMLINFRNAFFEPYQGYYTEEGYFNLIEFYRAHRDDTIEGGDIEAQHEIMTRNTAERACKANIKTIAIIEREGLKFLDLQSNLWYGMLREMEKAQYMGGPITPKLEFLKKDPNPVMKLSDQKFATPLQNQSKIRST